MSFVVVLALFLRHYESENAGGESRICLSGVGHAFLVCTVCRDVVFLDFGCVASAIHGGDNISAGGKSDSYPAWSGF